MLGFRLCADFLAEDGMRKWDSISLLYTMLRLWTSGYEESDSICGGTVALPIITVRNLRACADLLAS
jgi:hypothetical protein